MGQITEFLLRLLLYCNRAPVVSNWMNKAVNLSIAKTSSTIPSQFAASVTTWVCVCSAASTWTSKACIAFEIRPLLLEFTFRFRC